MSFNINLDFYNQHGEEFYKRSINRTMQEFYNEFLQLIPAQALILDAGSGSGRDSKYFLDHGYKVIAFDASEEMVRLSTTLTGNQTLKLRFQDINFENEFDAVWASASLLHVPKTELMNVLTKLKQALKEEGIMYMSFKYGKLEQRYDGERVFYDQTEATLREIMEKLGDMTEIKIWATPDTGVSTSEAKLWLNAIYKRGKFANR